MNSLDNLKRQHIEIEEVLNETVKLIKVGDLKLHGQAIAKNISILAGKLKVHLSAEDNYLYPDFLNNSNLDLRKTAQSYIDEMGDLSSTYMEFKGKYNTERKILKAEEDFVKESKAVFTAIEKRMNKEDKELYVLAAKM